MPPQESMLVLASKNQSLAVLLQVGIHAAQSQMQDPLLPYPELHLCCFY